MPLRLTVEKVKRVPEVAEHVHLGGCRQDEVPVEMAATAPSIVEPKIWILASQSTMKRGSAWGEKDSESVSLSLGCTMGECT